MISLKVIDVKAFMNLLLVKNVFDNFYLWEADFKTFADFSINGKLNDDYYSSDELEILEGRKYATWAEVKPFAFSYIKGNKLPVAIKIVMMCSKTDINRIISTSGIKIAEEEIKGLFLNVKYEKGNINITTGTSFRSFTLDKTLEHIWDEEVKQFLKGKEITWEEL